MLYLMKIEFAFVELFFEYFLSSLKFTGIGKQYLSLNFVCNHIKFFDVKII